MIALHNTLLAIVVSAALACLTLIDAPAEPGLPMAASAIEAAPKDGTRHPDSIVGQAFEMFDAYGPRLPARTALAPTVNKAAKADRLVASDECAASGWPYVPAHCLEASAGRYVRHVSRTVTTERRPAKAVSVLVRMPAPLLAER